MTSDLRKYISLSVALAAIALLITSMLTLAAITTAHSGEQPVMSNSEALELGQERARRSGLRESPSSVAAEQMTLEEYTSLTNWGIGTDGPKVGLEPDRQVWVVSMWGNGTSTWPGNPGTPGVKSEPEKFDGLTEVFDARTGQTISTKFSRPGVGELPLLTRVP